MAGIPGLLQRYRHRGLVTLHDLGMIPVAWFGAFWLRFNLDTVPFEYQHAALTAAPLVCGIQGWLLWRFGLYRGEWRFASLPDLMRILKAVATGMLLTLLALFLITRLVYIPRTVFPLYALLLTGLLGGPRLFYRWSKDRKLYMHGGQRVLIVGAGRAGEMLVRDMLRDPTHRYQPIGFIDDNPEKRGRDIHGVRVLGHSATLPKIARDADAEIILLAVPSATVPALRRLIDYCEESALPFRILPRMDDLVSGHAWLTQIREVAIDDLLGRAPVALEWDVIRAGLSGKTVMVSGGGGSIGSELCHQVARLQPKTLVILEHNEHNLYQVERALRDKYPALALHAMLCDICDPIAVQHAFRVHRPEIVFHAAAYKHVPLLEQQVREAVRNNVLGTRVMAQATERHGGQVFVLISSDKAVEPKSILGATKQIAELYCQGLACQSATRFITVRFGNVLGSMGSVIPLFRDQIAAGGPVTITHPETTRYFMTVGEACQLIMQAAVLGTGREVFVLDMGEPVKIRYLAEQMIRLSGKRLHEEVGLRYIGLRPGEKLHEQLYGADEEIRPSPHPKLISVRPRGVDLRLTEHSLDELERACVRYDEERLYALLTRLLPSLTRVQTAERIDNVIPLPRTKT